MDFTDLKGNKQETVTRIAICVVAALVLYGAAEKLADGDKLKIPEKYLCWLRENKVEAIALLSAVLYGVSLALWPLAEKVLPCDDDPCRGYEAV